MKVEIREVCIERQGDLMKKEKSIDTLMSGLKVRVECNNTIRHESFCSCNGTGYIVRDATAGEVREMIVNGFFPADVWENKWTRNEETNWWEFELKSGGILYMEMK